MDTKVAAYIRQGIESYIKDPADSPFQRGYLAALLAIWDEGLEAASDENIDKARAQL